MIARAREDGGAESTRLAAPAAHLFGLPPVVGTIARERPSTHGSAASTCCTRAAGSLGRTERLTLPVSPRRQHAKEHGTAIRYNAALVSGGGDAGPKGEAMYRTIEMEVAAPSDGVPVAGAAA
jgi:hypothetical protein